MVNDFTRALLMLDRTETERLISVFLEKGTPIQAANELVMTALQRIGAEWEKGRLALSQVYMSGIICEEIIDKILPPASKLRKHQPKMAIGVFEDYHFLGKRIIYSVLRASGFELMDLGGGLTAEKADQIVRKENIKILLLSVLMLPSALRIKGLVEKLSDTDVKIIVGGAPFRFDSRLWQEIGADAAGKDPQEAIDILTRLIGVCNA